MHSDTLKKYIPHPAEIFVIAGPCSAESPEQIQASMEILAQTGRVAAMRAGVWKPRTRPGSFEGRGAEALPWLKESSQATGMPLAIEVGNTKHVDEALKADIDILWIGARTTVNPFYVSEIAEALRGTNKVVMVKNPLHPEMSLWLGAIERMEKNGVEKVIGIHRGFYTPDNSLFRNDPKWELTFEFRRTRPDVPLICDPSHIAGRRNLVPEVAQTALNLDLDGLMVEVHPNPPSALSDAAQQLYLRDFDTFISSLTLKREDTRESATRVLLSEIRAQIDQVDEDLLDVLARRFNLVSQIGQIKKDNSITIFQWKRWLEILEVRTLAGNQLSLDNQLVEDIFQVIHKHSVQQQTHLYNKKGEENTKNQKG